MKILRIIILSFLLCMPAAWAIDPASYKKYEESLNKITTLSGDFTQANTKGHKAHGTIYISRPGKMRLDYAPPSPLVIVADGEWLITYDREHKEVDYVSIENTPAQLILSPKIRFSGDVVVTELVPKEKTTEISLVRREEPDAGTITLVFTNDPVGLKEWRVVDAQGVETRVKLSNLKKDVTFKPDTFKIAAPNLIQRVF